MVLVHNARPHSSKFTHAELAKFKWEQLDTPPCSPDMSPCDFHLFVHPEKHLKGKRFNSDDELKNTDKNWVSPWSEEFKQQGILWFVNQWDRCAQSHGVYFE
ncbi:histone-lysine N-methyltransferase SETMAR [Trichonephila clavipes]|uniref:Histone-lysine N-methyltransferase SETMAR n=1 Tax=Trichonephila clavipes TaxID=2585209 RepID=A0A8X6W492_TRICX|nr:histone-lysine N-methyltransferase SETMAR [Trichonephila clavipes]